MRKDLWSQEENDVIESLYATTTIKEIAARLHRSENSIRQRGMQLGLKRNNYDFWSNEEEELLKSNYPHKKKDELLSLFPSRSWEKIKKRANILGLRKQTKHLDRISGDLRPLLENSLQAFYWIGFVLSDGHVSTQNRLTVTISQKDASHLQSFADFLKLKVSPYKSMARISCMDNFLVPQIKEKFQIKNNKTYSPPDFYSYEFSDELITALIIGFIDGDGSIQNQYKRKDFTIAIKLHSSWLKNLEFIYGFLTRKGFPCGKPIINNQGYAKVCFSSRRTIKYFTEFIKSNDLLVMERKWNPLF